MHLDEETMQRLLHDELEEAEVAAARLHLSECDNCRARFAEASQEEKEMHELLRLADHPAPSVSAEDIAGRAGANASNWGIRLAASMVAALAIAGGVYAVPGSPVPKWVNALMDWIQERPARNVPQAAPPESSDSRMSGISVPPGENLVIIFTSSQTEGIVSVNLTDEQELVVRGPADSATFTSGPDQLTVHNDNSSASFEVQVPRDAQRIEIRVQDRTIFVKDGADIRAEKSAEGSFSLPLSGSLSLADSISR